MKRGKALQPAKALTKAAVLLIPEPEHAAEPPTHGIKPGYYDAEQLLELVLKHKASGDAIQFIADMLETGDAADDGFAMILRQNRNNPAALAKIVKSCKE